MLRAAGFEVGQYYNWRRADIGWVDDLKEYYLGKRITVTPMLPAVRPPSYHNDCQNSPIIARFVFRAQFVYASSRI